MMGNKRIF